jgi:hypothetical protein
MKNVGAIDYFRLFLSYTTIKKYKLHLIKLLMGNIFSISFRNFKGRKNLEDIDIEGRIILE